MSECPICKGEKYLIINGEVEDCQCVIQRRILNLYTSSGIPLEFMNVNIDHFTPKTDADKKPLSSEDIDQKQRARNAVTAFITQMPKLLEGEPFSFEVQKPGATEPFVVEGKNLALAGGYKSGKSLLAAIIAKGAISQSIKPKIIEWASVIDACYDFDADEVFEEMQLAFATKKILIIENVDIAYQPQVKDSRGGLGKISPFAVRKLDLLFSQRKGRRLPVVFTTSDEAKEFLKMPYGPILRSILNDTVVVRLPSPPAEEIDKSIEERIF